MSHQAPGSSEDKTATAHEVSPSHAGNSESLPRALQAMGSLQAHPSQGGPKRLISEPVLCSLIALAGVLSTAVAANAHRWRPDANELKAEIIGYRPTNNFETELRHYLELTGGRAGDASFTRAYLDRVKAEVVRADPAHAAEKLKQLDSFVEKMVRYDETVELLVPVYQKFFTLEELHELNRFYSTAPMQALVSKMPALEAESVTATWPIFMRTLEDVQKSLRPVNPEHSPLCQPGTSCQPSTSMAERR